MRAQRGAGSVLAGALLEDPHLASSIWIVEPIAPPVAATAPSAPELVSTVGGVSIEPSQPGVSTPSV